MATIKDVAKHAGVSIATVSKVINNKGSVSEKTRKKVLESIKTVNYQKNIAATTLKTKHSKTIGLVIPSIANPFFAALAQSIEREIMNNEYILFLCNTSRNETNEIRSLKSLVERQVDGIIIFSPSLKASEWINENINNDLVMISIEEPIEGERYDTIYIDNVQGMKKAVEYIVSLQHERIAYITGPLSRECNRERLATYKETLETAGVPIIEEFIKEGDFTYESGYNIAWQLLNHPKRPTAIFAGNDIMAFGVIKCAVELGIKVPEQLSVIGYDNIPQSSIFIPPLTTIDQPTEKIGKGAANYIMNKINNREEEFDNIYFIYFASLIIRRSTHYRV